jgi:transcriptional regulator
MYVPKAFEKGDLGWAQALMRRESFALLVTAGDDGAPFATHLPLHLDAARGAEGTLVGHVARANPHWRHFDGRRQAMAVFQGPHAYVSPSWYASRPMVPTWNYAAVHAYGAPAVIEDEGRVRDLLRGLSGTYETGRPAPWRLDELPAHYLAGMIRGIVAFEMPIARIEAKAELGQNRAPADLAGAIAGLRAAGDPLSLAVAAMMEEEA